MRQIVDVNRTVFSGRLDHDFFLRGVVAQHKIRTCQRFIIFVLFDDAESSIACIRLVFDFQRRDFRPITNRRNREIIGSFSVLDGGALIGINEIAVTVFFFQAHRIIEGNRLAFAKRQSLHGKLTGILVVFQRNVFQ